MNERPRNDWVGALVGFLTFGSGIVLLGFTFKLAFDMFSIPPAQAIGIPKGAPVDFAKAGESLASILVKIVLLLVMAAVGSMIANRGIKLYVSARAMNTPKPEPPATIERAESSLTP